MKKLHIVLREAIVFWVSSHKFYPKRTTLAKWRLLKVIKIGILFAISTKTKLTHKRLAENIKPFNFLWVYQDVEILEAFIGKLTIIYFLQYIVHLTGTRF